MGVALIERYSLNPKAGIMVGDMSTDRTFAERLGMRFVLASETPASPEQKPRASRHQRTEDQRYLKSLYPNITA